MRVNTRMKIPRIINRFDEWFERQPEPKRVFLFMLFLTLGLLGFCIGVELKSRILMLIGMCLLAPAIQPAIAQAKKLGHKNTVSVILVAGGTIIASFLILSIF